MKIHDISAQHIFPNKLYTTYECIPELVVTTVAAARHTIVKKIKPPMYLHIFTNISQQSVQHDFILLCVCVCVFIQLNQWKLPTGWHYRNRISQCSCKNSMTLSSFSRTFHNFPWPLLFSITFQAWKMVLQNSMTFQDQWAPCKYIICLQVQYSRYTGHRLNNAFISIWQPPP